MSEETSYERLYREAIPSVVSIYVSGEDRRGQRGSGSGFVYRSTAAGDGYVVTNQHVVETADAVDVRFSDGQWRTGETVGTDTYTDLAVLSVPDLPADATPLPVAVENPTPGRPVAALGNPMGLDGSISRGIVSGDNRSMPTREGFAIPDTVQTDAPINPGNSGGPLVTYDQEAGAEEPLDVEVVGVNRARGGDNIGFAVSAAIVNRVVPALIDDGRFQHPYLKIQTIDVSPTVAEANDLAETRGVLVVDVRLGPASAALVGCAGTRRVRGRDVPTGGDVLVAIDDQPIDTHEELLRYLLLETAPGESITVSLRRDGEALVESLTLGERPPPSPDGNVVLRQ